MRYTVEIELRVADLIDTRFAISPLAETVFSLWALTDPGGHALHLPWLRAALPALAGGPDLDLLRALVGPSRRGPGFVVPSRPVPDFLTPRPRSFSPSIEEELARVRATPPRIVRRDIRATHAPAAVPAPLATVDGRRAAGLRDRLCDALHEYWQRAVAPHWPAMRLVLEADTTYRAHALATGGAGALFADMHPNVRWRDGVLAITEMMDGQRRFAAGRGLLLMPSVFARKPIPPLGSDEPPSLSYPSRGVATLWAPAPPMREAPALAALIGPPRARLLALLDEPLATAELARRLRVTPSAVNQHLKVLHGAGLLTKQRHGRQVLYRRNALGDALSGG